MGSAGLPSLSGFIGEFFSIFGTFNAEFPKGHEHYIPNAHLMGALACTGVILGAVYLLFMFQKVFFGKLDKAKNGKLPDLKAHELAAFIPLCLAIFLLGLFPRPILTTMQPSVDKFLHDYTKRIDEPDGPPHMYGLPPPGTAPTGGAQ